MDAKNRESDLIATLVLIEHELNAHLFYGKPLKPETLARALGVIEGMRRHMQVQRAVLFRQGPGRDQLDPEQV